MQQGYSTSQSLVQDYEAKHFPLVILDQLGPMNLLSFWTIKSECRFSQEEADYLIEYIRQWPVFIGEQRIQKNILAKYSAAYEQKLAHDSGERGERWRKAFREKDIGNLPGTPTHSAHDLDHTIHAFDMIIKRGRST